MTRLKLAIPTEAAYRSLYAARFHPAVMALADDLPTPPTLTEFLATRRDRMSDPACVERVILIDNDPAGTVTAFKVSTKTRACEVGIVLVHPHHWGQGFGPQALRPFLDLLRVMGMRRVSLETFETNTRAQAAFRKLGFVEVSRYNDLAIRQRLVVMQRTLPPLYPSASPAPTTPQTPST